MNNLTAIIEAILFVAGQPVSIGQLSKVTERSVEEIEVASRELQQSLQRRGIVITRSQDSLQMSTHPETSAWISTYLQSQLREKLTEAAVETLAIIVYKQPISKAEIESIRGVSSQYVLRVLSQRGLIEKVPSPSDARLLLYKTTHEFLNHMGLTDIKDLPDLEEIIKNLDTMAPETKLAGPN
jgi:segregation and condensation protein B